MTRAGPLGAPAVTSLQGFRSASAFAICEIGGRTMAASRIANLRVELGVPDPMRALSPIVGFVGRFLPHSSPVG